MGWLPATASRFAGIQTALSGPEGSKNFEEGLSLGRDLGRHP
jgi:hypothetical protein